MPLFFNRAPSFSSSEFWVVQGDNGSGFQALKVRLAVIGEPVVKCSTVCSGVRRFKIIDGDDHVGEGPVDHSHVDPFRVRAICGAEISATASWSVAPAGWTTGRELLPLPLVPP
jgi:hypothetical protein